jgi:transglutaminase-like putative cysteine protease
VEKKMKTNALRLLSFVIAALIIGSCSQLTAKKTSLSANRNRVESFKFSYQISVPDIPSGAKSIEVILPSPPSDDKQTIRNFRISSNLADSQYTDPQYGNNILLFSLRDSMPEAIHITMTFDATRKQRAPLDSLDLDKLSTATSKRIPDSLQRYLLSNALVPIDGQIQREADSLLNDSLSPLAKARALYNHLFETMKYDKSGVGWGNGDALYACDVRRGNCTDIHSLFIGMARSQGIPARFRIGFPLPTELSIEKSVVTGYHCWAEFYIADVGWIPVDISEAIKRPKEKEYYFGRLDPNRIGFTVGRDIIAPTASGESLFNYLIYARVFIDGQRFDDVKRRFTVSAS